MANSLVERVSGCRLGYGLGGGLSMAAGKPDVDATRRGVVQRQRGVAGYGGGLRRRGAQSLGLRWAHAPNPHPLDPVRVCEPKQAQAWKRADVGAGQFVRAISVCTALKAATAEIHGVELWGAAIDANGKVKPAKDSVKVELPHCEKWSARRACPDGSVATGVRAQLGDADIGAIGLTLRCHAIAPSPPSVK